ncbi:MAG: prepilin-type N-terminal cleavage/methylation domain-containing protein [Candidatus Rokubacteria bacterium]|nr:prepilin-type N-terminal cleavage/methylation domain-containing protein [Candidatus Rokubacteria bacterium]
MIARRAYGEAGFTLIEAILSLVVLGVALVPLINLFGQAAEDNRLPYQVVASGLAAAKMEELIAGKALQGWVNFMSSSTDQDTYVNVDSTNFPGYQWKWEVVRVAQSDFNQALGAGANTRYKRVTVFVLKPDSTELRLVTVVTDY